MRVCVFAYSVENQRRLEESQDKPAGGFIRPTHNKSLPAILDLTEQKEKQRKSSFPLFNTVSLSSCFFPLTLAESPQENELRISSLRHASSSLPPPSSSFSFSSPSSSHPWPGKGTLPPGFAVLDFRVSITC